MKKVGDMKKSVTKTFFCPEEKVEVLEMIDELRWKERASFSGIIITALEEYIKNHGEGNPNFTIPQFADEGFLARPALNNVEGWDSYLERSESDKNELQELEFFFGKYLNKVQKTLRGRKQ